MIEESRQVYEFDEFRLDVAKRQLLREGEVVPLYSKAFDLLLLLVESRGRDLGKDEILERVWPGQVLEESNLTVNISAVRRALGERAAQPRFLVTIPGRGYRFVANVNDVSDALPTVVIQTETISQVTIEEDDERNPSGIDSAVQPELLKGHARAGRRGRTFMAGGFIAVFIAIIGMGTYLWRRNNRPHFPYQSISIKRLTTNGLVSMATVSPDGKLFVYTIPEGDRESLWLGHIDGGEPIQIRAPADTAYLQLRFAPNGDSIYFVAREPQKLVLYRMPVFGGAPEKLVDNLGGLTFGPNGRIAFLRYDATRKLSLLLDTAATGGPEHELAVLPADAAWHGPAWSPNGAHIAVVATPKPDSDQLYLVDVASQSTRPLTSRNWRKLDGITWLKDGSGMVFVAVEKNSLYAQLWFVSFPGGEVQPVFSDLNNYNYATSVADDNSLLALQGSNQSNIWVAPAANLGAAKQVTFSSPGRNDGWGGLIWLTDGRIAHTADDGAGTSIWIMNADGNKTRQLIPSGGVNNYPSITADGRLLVFQSNRSGHFAVWRSDLDGMNMAQVTGDDTAAQPYVSPDGKYIIYISNYDSLGALWRISVSGGQPVRLTNGGTGWAQISPDSKSIVCEMNSKVAILSIEDGQLLKEFDFAHGANPRLGIHWTPDGKAVTYRDWVNGIWKQDLNGGAPKRLEGLPEEKLFSFGWSPDGKFFAYTRGATTRDVVLIQSQTK